MDERNRTERDPAEPVQDTFRKVYLGQVSDPLFPAHPEPQETSEEELTRLALEDPLSDESRPQGGPTLWRLITLVAFAVIALGIVFLWR
jgi:hypothetical protein